MTLAAIYLETFESLPSELVGKVRRSRATPVDLQERACRAYCKRMGYNVYYKVFSANTEAPHAELKWHLGFRTRVNPEQTAKRRKGASSVSEQAPGVDDSNWEVWEYFTHDSKHPYYVVQNLLAGRSIDVIVNFKTVGESGPMDWGGLRDAPRIEYASLWEIEPPDEYHLRLHELAERVSTTDSEEERLALMAQMNALSAEKKAAETEAALQAQAMQTMTSDVQALEAPEAKATRKWYRRYKRADDTGLDDNAQLGFIESVDFGIGGPNEREAHMTMVWYESEQVGNFHRLEVEPPGWGVMADSDVQAVLAEANGANITPDDFCSLLGSCRFTSSN